jgi:hypothetical protein
VPCEGASALKDYAFVVIGFFPFGREERAFIFPYDMPFSTCLDPGVWFLSCRIFLVVDWFVFGRQSS